MMNRWQRFFNVLLVVAGVVVLVVWAMSFAYGDVGPAAKSAIALVLLAGAPLAALLIPGGNLVKVVSAVVLLVTVDAANVYLLSLDDRMFFAKYWPWLVAYLVGAGIYWSWHQHRTRPS